MTCAVASKCYGVGALGSANFFVYDRSIYLIINI